MLTLLPAKHCKRNVKKSAATTRAHVVQERNAKNAVEDKNGLRSVQRRPLL